MTHTDQELFDAEMVCGGSENGKVWEVVRFTTDEETAYQVIVVDTATYEQMAGVLCGTEEEALENAEEILHGGHQ